MKRRCISLLLAAGLTVGCLSGCGGSDSKESASGNTEEAKEISLYLEDSIDADNVKKMVDAFTEETGIAVNIEVSPYSDMHEKLVTQFMSNENAYDLVIVDAYWVGEFCSSGWLEDLKPYVDKTKLDLSVYSDTVMKINGYYEDTLYMIPYANYGRVYAYDSAIFEDAELQAAYKEKFGEDLTTIDQMSMDQYVEFIKFVTEETGSNPFGTVMQGMRSDPISMEWLDWLFANGGDFYDEDGNITINSDVAVHTLELYSDAMNDGAMTGSAGFNFDGVMNGLAQGKAVGSTYHHNMLSALYDPEQSSISETVAISSLAGEGTVLNAGWGWGIPQNAMNKDAAWEFIDWLEKPEQAKTRMLNGAVNCYRTDVASDPEVIEKYPYIEDATKILDNSKMIPVMVDAAELIEVLGRELSECVAGNKTAQEALDKVAEEMESME